MNIRKSTAKYRAGITLAVVAMAAGITARAQLPETSIEDSLTGAIESQLEQEVTGQVEQDVSAAVEDTVEDTVAQTVEQEVTAQVEQTVEQNVAGQVEQAVESNILSTVEQQADDAITQAIEVQVEATVDAEVSDAIGDSVEAVVDASIEQDLALPAVPQPDVTAGLDNGSATPTTATDGDAFAVSVDPDGYEIERHVWVALVDEAQAASFESRGYSVRSRRALPALGGVLIELRGPPDAVPFDMAGSVGPGIHADFNHLYRLASPAAATAAAPAERPSAPPPECRTSRTGQTVVGIIDTAIVLTHEALTGADIVQADFVSVGSALRPRAHGTAVVSLLVGDAPGMSGLLKGARICAASVFFDADGAAATTADLVAALDWLASAGASAVNMSLTGPPNRLLEEAIRRIDRRGTLVVAAVGNAGPVAAPLYPAAYPRVIGATAVDTANRIFRHANRGPHVSFAARGVGVTVASASGGYELSSGTSMAAPIVTAAAILALGEHHQSSSALAALRAQALDLGDPGFDETYGFGLVSTALPSD